MPHIKPDAGGLDNNLRMPSLWAIVAYEERTYREWVRAEGFVRSRAVVEETDLLVLAPCDVSHRAGQLALEAREEILSYIRRDEAFRTALSPHATLPDAPPIAQRMAKSAALFGVGPMAAVAGAVAEQVGQALAEEFKEVVIENGGDIFVSTPRPVVFGFFAGENSPFTGTLRFRVTGVHRTYGVCTSSGTVGHSLSFGRADAVCVLCKSAADADAAATALANRVQKADDVGRVVEEAQGHRSILGIIAAKGDRIGLWGDIEII